MREEEINIPQPSTSATNSESEISNSTMTSTMESKTIKASTSSDKPTSNGYHEFGYNTTIPYAPWKRKRYNLSIDGLHEEIIDFYHWICPNELESRIRTQVFDKVFHVVNKKWANFKPNISVFGSLRTRLFLPTSDIDVLVEIENWPSTETGEWLNRTADALRGSKISEEVTVYNNAFVPIIKMVDKDTNLSVDISFNTVQGVRAAEYIGKVKEEFPVLEPLVLLIKQFLHYRKLNQTFTGGLSSYGLILMLVNFFQMYAKEIRFKTIYHPDVNLGELLLRFFEVYSCEFNYEDVGICVAQVRYITKTVPGALRYAAKRSNTGYLSLEDPLLKQNDVGRSTYNFAAIANAFGQALQILMVVLTVRDRKKSPSWNKVYNGSMLHLVIPFTSAELSHRNWLKGSPFRYFYDTVSYDHNVVTSTLLAPAINLNTFAWLKSIPIQTDKKSNALPITSPEEEPAPRPARVVENTGRKEAVQVNTPVASTEENRVDVDEPSSSTVETYLPSIQEIVPAVQDDVTTPPMPTSSSSIGTSGASCSTSSERDEMESPPQTSTVQSEDESVQEKSTQVEKGGNKLTRPYNEVAATAVTKKAPMSYAERTKEQRYNNPSSSNSKNQGQQMNGAHPHRSNQKAISWNHNKRTKSNGSQGGHSRNWAGSNGYYNSHHNDRSRRGASSHSNCSSQNSRSSSSKSNSDRLYDKNRTNNRENANFNTISVDTSEVIVQGRILNYAQAASTNLNTRLNNSTAQPVSASFSSANSLANSGSNVPPRKDSTAQSEGNSSLSNGNVQTVQNDNRTTTQHRGNVASQSNEIASSSAQNGNTISSGTISSQNGNDTSASYRNAAVRNSSTVSNEQDNGLQRKARNGPTTAGNEQKVNNHHQR